MSRTGWSLLSIPSALVSLITAFPAPVLGGPLFPNPVYTVGSNPYTLGMADFNRDGIPDLVTANFGNGYDGGGGDVSVLFGHGDGTFSKETRVPTSQHPSEVSAADIDGDGVGDLILTYWPLGQAVVMRGQGDGTFGSEVPLITDGVYRVHLADINDDNVPDLIQEIASASGGFVPLLGNGDGTFAAAPPVVPGATYGATVADLNGDGHDDVLVVPYVAGVEAHEMLALLGAGDGSFAPAGTLDVGEFLLDASSADLDGDGFEDLAVITYHYRGGINTDVALYFSNGDGTFTAGPKEIEEDLTALVASDRNGDGIQDFVRIGSGSVEPYLGSGNRTYTKMEAFFYTGFDNRGTQAADFDRDGRIDLALVANFSEAVFIYSGNASSGFGPPIDTTLRDAFFGGLVTDDFNGDGHLDMAAAILDQDEVAIKLGVGDGTFGAEMRFPAGVGPLYMASADVNSDALKDLVISLRNWHSEYPDPIPPGGLVTLLGNGDGTFQAPTAPVASGALPSAMHVSDVDGDGTIDAIVANWGDGFLQPDLSYFHGLGDGTFAPDVRLSAGTEDHYPYGWTSPMGVSSGDFDRDGKRDIAVSVDGLPAPGVAGSVRILPGLGGGSFAPFVTVGETVSSAGLTVSDLDGDGTDDIAVADPASYVAYDPGGLYTLLNDGTGQFAQSGLLKAGIGPFDVQVADMTGDGIGDLVSSLNAGYLAILPGLGGGAYGDPINFGFFGTPLALVVGNFDGDSLRDLLVISSSGTFVLHHQAQAAPPLEIEASIAFAGRSGTLTWSTNAETDLIGFNIVEQTAHGTRKVNAAIIPCTQCVSGLGDTYSFLVRKHRSGRSLFIEAVHSDHSTELFGPARVEARPEPGCNDPRDGRAVPCVLGSRAARRASFPEAVAVQLEARSPKRSPGTLRSLPSTIRPGQIVGELLPISRRPGTGCYANGTQWTTNAQSNVYWSSSTNTSSPTNAWAMDLFSRETNGGSKTLNL